MLDNQPAPTMVVARDLFSIPIVVCEWPETGRLNAELRKIIMERYETTPSVVESSRYAWQSDHDFHKWPQPCVEEFMAMVANGAAQMVKHMIPDADRQLAEDWQVVSCWGNVNPPGGFSNPHNHIETGATIAGFYYVDVGEVAKPVDGGCTIFQDRSGVMQRAEPGRSLLSREYALVPKPGRMALFPVSQMHYVQPYRGTGVRITIAFNLKHKAFDALYYPDMRDQSWMWRNFRGLMLLGTKVPEKLRALGLLAPYFLEEMRRPGRDIPISRRWKTALKRAEVNAGASATLKATEQTADKVADDKRQLV